MTKSPKEIGASVRARLLRLARERGEDFQLVFTRYANERLLYRLASSEHASRFVLKGAALFTIWTGKPHRATAFSLGPLGQSPPAGTSRRLARHRNILPRCAPPCPGAVFQPAPALTQE